MRVTFTPPSETEFKQLFLSSPLKKGGGLEDISIFQPKGIPHRRGSGIFSILTGVAKKVLPFLMKAAKPAAREFGSSVVRDVLKKKSLRHSLTRSWLAEKIVGVLPLVSKFQIFVFWLNGLKMTPKVGEKTINGHLT